jgi:hypothetical protein
MVCLFKGEFLLNMKERDMYLNKNLLKNYIYNAIKDFGLKYVIYCVEEGVEHLAMGTEEWAKEFELNGLLSMDNKKKGYKKLEYTGKINISELAQKRYGLLIDSKCRTNCPIHGGKNKTSLCFNNENNTFKCWSCGASGSILHFVKLMEDIKNE